MNRLQSEWHRLYLPRPTPERAPGDAAAGLIDAAGRTRALVLEVVRPAGWEEVARVWRGVQAELALPEPAIAVSGTDGFQLWFSLEEPICVRDAQTFLEGLRRRFLADVASERVRGMPSGSAAPDGAGHARLVPAEQAQPGHWSAFVAPDLAALFVDTPWLDFAPNLDGQADLLRRLASIDRTAFEAASTRLGEAEPRASAPAAEPVRDPTGPARAQTAASSATLDAQRFLLQVMNDDTAPLALRIEAAKALLLRPAV